jgi:hypothetical protein
MKNLMKYPMFAVLTAVCLSGLTRQVRAEATTAPETATAPGSTDATVATPATASEEDKWRFNSPLYLWAPALTGTATLKGNNVRVDESFTDLKDNMTQGFMAYLELGKPQYGFYVNPNYFALDFSGHEGPAKVDLGLDLTFVEMVGYYRIWNTEGDRPANLYVLGGARYWNLHENLRLKIPIVGVSETADTQWLLDPMIGFRFTEYITKRVHIMAQTDIGGFNLGYQTSRFSWQLMGTVGYDFTMPVIKKPSTVFAGWRQINLQKTSGSSTVNQNAINLNFSGILVGLNVQLF